MSGKTWEQVEGLEPGAGDPLAGDASWQGADQVQPGGDVSGETVEEPVEKVIERVLASQLGRLRQDLEGEIERRVQSFSDKTAHRLNEAQRERLRVLDEVMGGLKDSLGPDYDQIRRQQQLNILLEPGDGRDIREAGGGQKLREPQDGRDIREPATPQAGPESGFVQTYLSQRLGNPSDYTAEERQSIQRALSGANGWGEWMETVERLSQERAGRGQGQPEGSAQGAARAARAQPATQAGRPSGQMTLEQLSAALNKAATVGDLKEMERLGALIDKLVQ